MILSKLNKINKKIQKYISRRIILKKGLRSDDILPSIFYKYQFLKNIIIDIDTYALLRSQYWSREEIKDIQFERIKSIVTHANKYIPFWKERFNAAKIYPEFFFNWDTFLRIPILKKSDFKNNPREYFTDSFLFKEEYFHSKTSGSTGEPFEFYLDRYFNLRSIAVCKRVFTIASGGKLLPTIYLRAIYRYGFANKKSIWFYVFSYNHLKYIIDKFYETIDRIKGPYVIYGFSSYFLEIAKLWEKEKTEIYPTGVVISGEDLDFEQREYIKSKLKTKVYRSYGTLEFGLLSHDCEYGNQHFSTDYAYVEILDENNNQLKNGHEGKVVITSFDNKIMPFIRYDTGDIGTLSADFCICGRTSPCLKIVGRQAHMIKLSTGKEVPFIDLLGIFRKNNDIIKQFQFIQKNVDDFMVKIVEEQVIDDYHLVKITNDLRTALESSVNINFEIVKEIDPSPSGKKINFKSFI